MKKLKLVVITGLFLLASCAPNTLNKKVTEIAKSFYTEYLKANEGTDEAKILKIKNTYMTDVLAEEIGIRTRQLEADAVTGVQDSHGMINKMNIKEGEDDDSVLVTFDMFEEEGKPYRIYEIKLHFRDVDKKRLIDTLDMTIYDVDEDGDKIKNEYKTKWANKETLSEEDKKEMSEINRYFDDLAEEGYIG